MRGTGEGWEQILESKEANKEEQESFTEETGTKSRRILASVCKHQKNHQKAVVRIQYVTDPSSTKPRCKDSRSNWNGN